MLSTGCRVADACNIVHLKSIGENPYSYSKKSKPIYMHVPREITKTSIGYKWFLSNDSRYLMNLIKKNKKASKKKFQSGMKYAW